MMSANTGAIRSFNFDAQVKYAPLLHSLPNHTAIYHEWPPEKLRKTLPNYISAALIEYDGSSSASYIDDDLPMIGPPIHVQAGDILSVTLKNSLATTGLSLHWHGFEMTNALEYDGVVGVTQCPISPYTEFTYEFAVEETPGTYWWHTHSVCILFGCLCMSYCIYPCVSEPHLINICALFHMVDFMFKGTLGIHAINSIHGPLIVHPEGDAKKELVNRLNGASTIDAGTDSRDSGAGKDDIHIDINPWYYENERILFFKDGFIHPEALDLMKNMGGLNEAVSKDDSGHTVGTSAWEFGTCKYTHT